MTILLAVAFLLAQAPLDTERRPLQPGLHPRPVTPRPVAGKINIRKLEERMNKRLLDEVRRNQCTFMTNSDQFDRNCDTKLYNLSVKLINAKRRLDRNGVKNFKFEVSGHTETTGDPVYNKALSARRAAVIVAEMQKRGMPASEIVSVGKGADEPLVTPDDTPVKKARNRRYEIRVRL
jgi:outer membrane protein OmpA-like peptidoglycan-associated protein